MTTDVALEQAQLPLVQSPEPVTEVEAPTVPEPQQGDQYWSQINTALKTGASRQDVKSYMAKNLNMSEDDADLQIVKSVADRITKAYANGASDEDVQRYLEVNNYAKDVADSAIKYAGSNKEWKRLDWQPNAGPQEATDLTELYKNVYGKYSTQGKSVLGFFGNEQAATQARQEINQLNSSMVDYLNQNGFKASLSPETGELTIENEQGRRQAVDSSMLASLFASKGEIAGSIAGAIGGAKLGSLAPGIAKIPGTIGGAVVGGASGAALGKAADLAINSFQLKEKLEADLYLTQMKEAAITDVALGTLGTGLFKLGAKGYKTIMKAYDFALAGNAQGAAKLLRDSLHLTEDQAQEITQQFVERLDAPLTRKGAFGRTVPLNEAQTEIAALASTQQGAEGFVRQAAGANPQLANAMRINLDNKAKDVTRAINSVTDDNTASLMRQDLKAYQKDVKDYYGAVKREAADNIDGTDFRFDLDKLAIEPVLKDISGRLSNPIKREGFVNYAARIEEASADRTFSGLLELRQAVNDYKYSKSGLGKRDIDALNTVLNKVDTQINKAAKDYLPNSKEWSNNWSSAKTEYAKMKVLEENAMFKTITREGATETAIQRGLNRYGNDLDIDSEIFNAVAERLTPATRVKAEGAAIKNTLNKFTGGRVTDQQVVDFPALYDSLSQLNLQTPEAKKTLEAVDQMARVFKNDPALASMSGNLNVPRPATALTDDLTTKARWAIMGAVWNELTTIVPGKSANTKALAKQLNSILENPMNFKSSEAFVKSFPPQSQGHIRTLMGDLRAQQATNAAKGQGTPPTKQRMYRQTKSGSLTATDGALGKGIYLVDKIAKPNPNSKVAAQEVDLSRLANMDTVSNIVGRTVEEKELRNMPEVQQQLRDAGYLGITVPGRAMLFPEKVVGSSAKQPVETLYRAAPTAETNQTVKARENAFVYTTTDQTFASDLAATFPGGTVSKLNTPIGKVLELDRKEVAEEALQKLFGGKLPNGVDDIEDFGYQLHEGALVRKGLLNEQDFVKWLKDHKYVGHSFGIEKAFLPEAMNRTRGK